MTTEHKVTRRKPSLLQPANGFDNVSEACRIMGYSRPPFFEGRKIYRTRGADGLIDRLLGARAAPRHRVAEEVEEPVLVYSLDHPSDGTLRFAKELALEGFQVSSGGVRGVWSRHPVKRGIELTDEQMWLLERFSPLIRERHITARHTSDPVATNTFFAGDLECVGEVSIRSTGSSNCR